MAKFIELIRRNSNNNKILINVNNILVVEPELAGGCCIGLLEPSDWVTVQESYEEIKEKLANDQHKPRRR